MEIFEQVLPTGRLKPNMTNEKGDSLVSGRSVFLISVSSGSVLFFAPEMGDSVYRSNIPKPPPPFYLLLLFVPPY